MVVSPNEPSLSVPGSPCLSDDDVIAIGRSKVAVKNLVQASGWFFKFLVRNRHWIEAYDYNHLRVTRVIKSLRLLSGDKVADRFKASVIKATGDSMELIDVKARQFWEDA